MKTSIKRLMYWSPRILSICLAIFISLFALDVFSEGYGPGKTVLALLIHLIPTFLIVIMSIIAWYREGIGGILFLALAASYVIMNGWRNWIIPGPIFLIGILFLINRKYGKQD